MVLTGIFYVHGEKLTNKSGSAWCWFGTMGPQLVPEQHTVVSNIKFLMPGLASKFYFSHSKLIMPNYYALVTAINILRMKFYAKDGIFKCTIIHLRAFKLETPSECISPNLLNWVGFIKICLPSLACHSFPSSIPYQYPHPKRCSYTTAGLTRIYAWLLP